MLYTLVAECPISELPKGPCQTQERRGRKNIKFTLIIPYSSQIVRLLGVVVVGMKLRHGQSDREIRRFHTQDPVNQLVDFYLEFLAWCSTEELLSSRFCSLPHGQKGRVLIASR